MFLPLLQKASKQSVEIYEIGFAEFVVMFALALTIINPEYEQGYVEKVPEEKEWAMYDELIANAERNKNRKEKE